MRSVGVLAFVSLCAGTITSAQDASAPLSTTRQQLQTLKKDQAAEKSGTNEPGLKGSINNNDISGGMNLTAPTTGPEREKPEKKDTRRNWLIDGYEKLDPKAAKARAGDKPEEEEKPLDPKDPDYFLRVYERQRATNEAKRLQQEKLEDPDRTDGGRANAPDPFAPFLSSWLAGSPVKDVLRETTRTTSHSNRAAINDGSRLAESESRGANTTNAIAAELNLTPRTNTDAGATNPFVQALGLGNAATNAASPPRSSVAVPAFTPPPPSRNTELSLPPPVRSALPERPTKVPDENQKYFPQLKKF